MKNDIKLDTEQRGYKNLFLQIFQLKNFLWFVGGGTGTFVLIYAENDKWLRVQPFFLAWIISIVAWFFLVLFIYKGELENRIISYIAAVVKRIIPILLILLSLYLILLPIEFKKTLGILALAFTAMIFLRGNKGLSKLLDNSRGARKKNKLMEEKKTTIRLTNWTATETNNEQGADYNEINLEGQQLKTLEFKVKPSSAFWRAGFKITDPNGSILPLRRNNSILFHVGSTEFRSKFGVTAYINGDWVSDVNKTIDFDNEGFISIKFEVNEKNFIKCFINNKIEFKPKERIDPRILEKVFLAAWGDGNPYRVEFEDIQFTTR